MRSSDGVDTSLGRQEGLDRRMRCLQIHENGQQSSPFRDATLRRKRRKRSRVMMKSTNITIAATAIPMMIG